jgi:hypothetical protein
LSFYFAAEIFLKINIRSRRCQNAKGTTVVAWLKNYHQKKNAEKAELGG